MSYTQKWVLKKSGSDWDFTSEAVEELQKDVDDSEYISSTQSSDQFEENFTLDDVEQTLTYERVWTNQSDCESFIKTNTDNGKFATLESNLSSTGWTITEI